MNDNWKENNREGREKMEDIFEDMRESGALRDEPSKTAPDYEHARFDNTDGQRFVERSREAAKALPEPERSFSEKVKDFAAGLWKCVFHKPHFSWPEPDLSEKANDPLTYTGKEPERLMELAGIDPDDEPLSGIAPSADDVDTAFLPESKLNNDELKSRAANIIRDRAQDADRGFYKNAMRNLNDPAGSDAAFHEFLGNALMNETAESSGWVEDKAGVALQAVLDRVVSSVKSRESVDEGELTDFVRESVGAEGDPFDIQNFGDAEAFCGVLSEALARAGSYTVDNAEDPFDKGTAHEEAFTDVVELLGQVYHDAIQNNND